MNKGGRLAGIICIALAVCSGCGCGDGIRSARGYVVEVVEGVGESITSKAATLAEALRALWRRAFPDWEGNVQVDPDDPLRGTLHGEFRLIVVIADPGGRKDKIALNLTNPRMCRDNADSPFEPCPSNYPPALRKRLQDGR